MKLSEGLEIIIGSILIMNPLPSISHAYRLPLQEENHRKLYLGTPTSEELMAFTANNNRRMFQDRPKTGYSRQGFNQNNVVKIINFFVIIVRWLDIIFKGTIKFMGIQLISNFNRQRKIIANVHEDDENSDNAGTSST